MALDESSKAIMDLDHLRLRNKNVRNAKLLDQKSIKPQEEYQTKLHGSIVKNVVEDILLEYHARVNYVHHRKDETTFWVFRKQYKQYSCTPTNPAEFSGYMIPKYAWIRTIRITEFQGRCFLVCSCGKYQRFGWGCRHGFKVRDSFPTPEDCTVRSRIDYLRYFKKPGFDQLTKIFQDCLRNEPPGIPLGERSLLVAVGQGDATDTMLVERSRNTMMGIGALIRPGNHWYLSSTVNEVQNQQTFQSEANTTKIIAQQVVQNEENLSQYAQQVENVCNQMDHLSDDNSNHEFPITISITTPTPQRLHDNSVAISSGGAYHNMSALFQQMSNLADTDPYLYDIMWQSLNQAAAVMNSGSSRIGCSTMGSVLTQPNIDKARKCTRKRQQTSPGRGKKSKS